MEEQDINATELQLICDRISKELLDNLVPRTDLTTVDKHSIALRTLLNAVRNQINIPEWYPVFGSEQNSPKQNDFNVIQQLIHSRGISAKPYVIDFLIKIFGEKDANFGDL